MMSAHYEIAALFLQFENPWLRCPNSRSFFFLPNKQSGSRELLELIQPINEIRAPDQLSISVILLASTVFPHSETSVSSITSSHNPLPSLRQRLAKRQCFSTCDSLVQEQYPSQNPSPQAVFPHISLATVVSPYPKDSTHISEIKGSFPNT